MPRMPAWLMDGSTEPMVGSPDPTGGSADPMGAAASSTEGKAPAACALGCVICGAAILLCRHCHGTPGCLFQYLRWDGFLVTVIWVWLVVFVTVLGGALVPLPVRYVCLRNLGSRCFFHSGPSTRITGKRNSNCANDACSFFDLSCL